jgi:hypothetical protein
MKNLFDTIRAMYAPKTEEITEAESHQAAQDREMIKAKRLAMAKSSNAFTQTAPYPSFKKKNGDMLKAGGVKEEAETVEFSLTEEEWDQLDELSKSTLGSYVKKSSQDSRIKRKIAADFENKADRSRKPGMKAAATELSDKYKSKSFKRQAGIDKAVDRLTKEEVEELDEISTKTLARAAKAASDPDSDYYYGKSHDAQKFADHAKKTKDAKSAAAVQGAADAKGHYPRDNHTQGYDKLTYRTPPRVTAAGKANKQDIKALKTKLKEEVEQVDEKFGGTQNMLNQTTHKNADPMRRLKVTTDHPRFKDKPLNATSQGILKNRLKSAQGTHSKPNLPEEIDLEQVDETVLHKDVEFEINLTEKDYKAYFKAAMKGKDLGSMDEPEKKKFFNKVDAGYKAKNEDVFLEAMFDSHINDIISAHRKTGNRISDEKSVMSDGKMKHSYVVTTPEGKRTRHIHHGSTKKLETMSPAKRSKQSQEQDLDDK